MEGYTNRWWQQHWQVMIQQMEVFYTAGKQSESENSS